jgi:hypothetical protein
MRRDLAVARTKSGTEAAHKSTEVITSTNAATDAPKPVNTQPDKPNSDPVATTTLDQPKPQFSKRPIQSAKEDKPQPVTSPKKRSSPSLEDDTSFEPAAKKQAVGNDNSVLAGAPATEPKLELNTNPAGPADGEQSAEDKAPDTGTFSNTGDLDSLFNDAASGGGMGGDNGEELDFGTSADLNAEFDMASFTNGLDANKSNDNDNISALLPGLQDYANDTAGAEPDFSSFFSAEPTTNPPDQTQNSIATGGEQQNNNMQHDNTFDDIFDMTFDMGDGGQNQNAESDFNFEFN